MELLQRRAIILPIPVASVNVATRCAFHAAMRQKRAHKKLLSCIPEQFFVGSPAG
jgi:hypothetical protein